DEVMRRCFLLCALAGCSSPCGDGVSAPQLVMTSADMTVEITTSPYALTVRDATGAVIVEDGTLGWTSGSFGVGKSLYNGYFFFEPHFDPWREEMRVVAAKQTDSEIDVTLHGDDDACITVSHVIRAGALRVEAHRGGADPRAWEIGFASASDEAFLGLGERYDQIDHRGMAVYNWPEEGGLTMGEAAPPSVDNPYPNG